MAPLGSMSEGLGLTLTWQHSTYMGETEVSPDPEMHQQQFKGSSPSSLPLPRSRQTNDCRQRRLCGADSPWP